MPKSVSDRLIGIGKKGQQLTGLLALFALVTLSGCASFSDAFSKVEHATANRNLPVAIKTLEEMKLSGADTSLNHLNLGMLYRLQGDYAKSNAELDSAKRILDEVGAISVSEQAMSVVNNDTSKAYEGDGNEQLLIYAFKALNYLQAGDVDAAAVEARQFDIKHRLVMEKNPEAKFLTGAFARYLNGMVYEAVGEEDSARIEYSKAIEGYKEQAAITGFGPPKGLLADLARVEGRGPKKAPPRKVAAPPPAPVQHVAAAEPEPEQDTGKKSKKGKKGKKAKKDAAPVELPVAEAAVPAEPPPAVAEPEVVAAAEVAAPAVPAGSGEVVFFLHNGLGPSAAENIIQLPNPTAGAVLLRVALPKFVQREVPVDRVELTAAGVTATSELAENINALARKSLDDRLPAITARAVARLVAKNVAAAAVKKQADDRGGGGLGSLLVKIGADVAAVASERADTRTWALLPGNVQLARLTLPAGKHTLRATYYATHGGRLVTREYPVEVRAGRKSFVSDYYVVAPPPAQGK